MAKTKKVDKHNYLETSPFSFEARKEGKVFVFWEGKQVKILKDKEASKLLKKLEPLSTYEQQLVLAKLTGNFKRGNEKL